MVCLIKCVWFNIFSLFGPMYDLINRYGLFGREEYVIQFYFLDFDSKNSLFGMATETSEGSG